MPFAATFAVPSAVVPSVKLTVPVIVPLAEPFTVAVRTSPVPAMPVVGAATSAVVVGARLTTCTMGDDVPEPLFGSPRYAAEMACEPTAREEVANVAVPLVPEIVPEPILVDPSRKFTVPVGETLAELVTVAVNVTAVPYMDGLPLDCTETVVAPRTSWFRTALVLPRM